MSALALALTILAAPPPSGPVRWTGCDICKASFMAEAAAAFEKKTGVKISVEEMGDAKGMKEVLAGNSQMGGTCRHTLNTPEEHGIKLVPVAWDALVVVTHPSNPVSNLTMAQIRDVFIGKVTNWKALGGKDQPITIIARSGKTSGVGLVARELIFKNPEQDFAKSAKRVFSTVVVEETCEKDPGCVAITGISSARLRPGLKVMSIEGKQPTPENVASGAYLLYRPLYLSYPANHTDPRVIQFVKFMLSPEGQAVLAKTGTVNLTAGKALWGKYKAAVSGQ